MRAAPYSDDYRRELDQALHMVDAPSDGFSAGQWCEAANVLATEVQRLNIGYVRAAADADMWCAEADRRAQFKHTLQQALRELIDLCDYYNVARDLDLEGVIEQARTALNLSAAGDTE